LVNGVAELLKVTNAIARKENRGVADAEQIKTSKLAQFDLAAYDEGSDFEAEEDTEEGGD
jgi:hypothetical protein